MKNILLLTVLLFAGFTISAQEDGEVIVIAELNRSEVRQFIEEAEDQFYAIFNDNVDDVDYKITCRKETPTGSNIPIRVCEPAFMIRARAENARQLDINGAGFATDQAIRAGLEAEYAILRQKMEQMTMDVPEFAEIANILTQLRARRDELTK